MQAIKATRMGDSIQLPKVVCGHDWRLSESGRLHTFVELGVHRGATSALMLHECPELELCVMVDEWCSYEKDHPYRKSGDGCSKFSDAEQAENMRLAEAAVDFAGERAFIYQTDSLSAAKNYAEWVKYGVYKKASIVLQDAAHDFDSVWYDLCAWWPLIERGGLLCVHDYGHRRYVGVKQAVDQFVKTNYPLKLNVEGTLAWMVKP